MTNHIFEPGYYTIHVDFFQIIFKSEWNYMRHGCIKKHGKEGKFKVYTITEDLKVQKANIKLYRNRKLNQNMMQKPKKIIVLVSN